MAVRFSDNMLKHEFERVKIEEGDLEKTESGEQKWNADRSYSTTSPIFTPEIVGNSLRKEYKEYEPEKVQRSRGELTFSNFFLAKEPLGNHVSAYLQSFCCRIPGDVMGDPLESSRHMFERVAIEWSAKKSTPCFLNEKLLNSSCSSVKEWNGRNMITDVESKLDKVEEGLFNQEQVINLSKDRNLHQAALKHDWAIVVQLEGDKVSNNPLVILQILAKDSDTKKSGIFVVLSQRDTVKSFAYWLEDKTLLHACWFMQKGRLENHLFGKYPTIEPMSLDKPINIHIEAAGRLNALNDLKRLDICQTFKVSNIQRDETTKCLMVRTPNNMDACDFTALDIPSLLPQSGKRDMETKKTLPKAWALTAMDVVEKAFQWWHQQSNLQNTRTMKTNHQSQSNSHHLLLLTSTLLAIMTLYAALKTSGCRSEENYSSRLNSEFQNETYSNQLFVMFNSLVFFLSVALMIRLFNGLPFRTWFLISVFSMIGAYMCIIMDLVKPRKSTFWPSS